MKTNWGNPVVKTNKYIFILYHIGDSSTLHMTRYALSNRLTVLLTPWNTVGLRKYTFKFP